MKLAAAQRAALKKTGYLVVRGLIPRQARDEALREINHRLGKGRRASMDAYHDALDYWSEDTDAPAVLDLLRRTKLKALVESLMGGPGTLAPVKTGQVALRFPAVNNSHGGPSFHVDGLYSHNPVQKGVPIGRFTMLAGVLLSDAPEPFMGNLAVCPGSHRTLAEFIKKRGPGRLRYGVGDELRLPKPVQVTGKAGDVILCHYQLAHDKEQNLSPHVRYMAYFRLAHADVAANGNKPLTDLWLEWPGLKAR